MAGLLGWRLCVPTVPGSLRLPLRRAVAHLCMAVVALRARHGLLLLLMLLLLRHAWCRGAIAGLHLAGALLIRLRRRPPHNGLELGVVCRHGRGRRRGPVWRGPPRLAAIHEVVCVGRRRACISLLLLVGGGRWCSASEQLCGRVVPAAIRRLWSQVLVILQQEGNRVSPYARVRKERCVHISCLMIIINTRRLETSRKGIRIPCTSAKQRWIIANAEDDRLLTITIGIPHPPRALRRKNQEQRPAEEHAAVLGLVLQLARAGQVDSAAVESQPRI